MRFSKRRSNFKFITIFTIATGMFLSGCWSGNEVDDLAIINVMGIDVNQTGDFDLTVRVVKPQELYSNSANNSKADNNYQPLIETGRGKSIVEAMGNLSERISNRMYLGHVQVVILGEKVARNHLQEALDFLSRENHFRPNIKLLVTDDHAKPILSVKPRLETTLGAELNSFLDNTKYHPTSMVTDITQFMEVHGSQTGDPYTGAIRLENVNNHDINDLKNIKKGSQNSDQTIDKENNDEKLVLEGTAVFKKNGLMGFLNSQETQGLLWVKGKVMNDIVVLSCPGRDQGTVSLRISNTESLIKPKIVNGLSVIDDTIKVNADMRQMTCKKMSLSTEQIKSINKQLKEKVLDDIDQVFNKAKREWQADIFGFGEAVYKKYPNEWEKLAPRWTQGELRKLKVNLHVNTNISNYGLVRQSKSK